MRYVLNWKYASSYGGLWEAGVVVELDEETAEVINRDSPGVLSPEGEAAARGLDAPPQDRMVRKASKRGAQLDIMSSENPGYGAEISRKNLQESD